MRKRDPFLFSVIKEKEVITVTEKIYTVAQFIAQGYRCSAVISA